MRCLPTTSSFAAVRDVKRPHPCEYVRRYLPALFWWEVLPLLQRLTLTGFVLLIDARYELTRVMVGTLVTLMYLIVLQTLRPYKHRSVNAIAFGAQLSLVSVFICATLLKVYYWVPADEAEDLMGFASGYHMCACASNLRTPSALTLHVDHPQRGCNAGVELHDPGAHPGPHQLPALHGGLVAHSTPC